MHPLPFANLTQTTGDTSQPTGTVPPARMLVGQAGKGAGPDFHTLMAMPGPAVFAQVRQTGEMPVKQGSTIALDGRSSVPVAGEQFMTARFWTQAAPPVEGPTTRPDPPSNRTAETVIAELNASFKWAEQTETKVGHPAPAIPQAVDDTELTNVPDPAEPVPAKDYTGPSLPFLPQVSSVPHAFEIAAPDTNDAPEPSEKPAHPIEMTPFESVAVQIMPIVSPSPTAPVPQKFAEDMGTPATAYEPVEAVPPSLPIRNRHATSARPIAFEPAATLSRTPRSDAPVAKTTDSSPVTFRPLGPGPVPLSLPSSTLDRTQGIKDQPDHRTEISRQHARPMPDHDTGEIHSVLTTGEPLEKEFGNATAPVSVAQDARPIPVPGPQHIATSAPSVLQALPTLPIENNVIRAAPAKSVAQTGWTAVQPLAGYDQMPAPLDQADKTVPAVSLAPDKTLPPSATMAAPDKKQTQIGPIEHVKPILSDRPAILSTTGDGRTVRPTTERRMAQGPGVEVDPQATRAMPDPPRPVTHASNAEALPAKGHTEIVIVPVPPVTPDVPLSAPQPDTTGQSGATTPPSLPDDAGAAPLPQAAPSSTSRPVDIPSPNDHMTPDEGPDLVASDSSKPKTPTPPTIAPPRDDITVSMAPIPSKDDSDLESHGRAGETGAVVLEPPGADKPRDTLPVLADPRTPRQISQQLLEVVRHAPGGPVEVALNPEELGRVRMVLAAQDTSIVVTLTTERPETADLMRRNLEVLQQDFRALGYRDVSFEFSGSHDRNLTGGQQHRGESDPESETSTTRPAPEPAPPGGTGTGHANGMDLRL